MEKKVIEDAAKSYADGIAQGVDRKTYCIEDFMAGVTWMLDSLWHEANEKPVDPQDTEYIVETKSGYYRATVFDRRQWNNIKRWCRISDILPAKD